MISVDTSAPGIGSEPKPVTDSISPDAFMLALARLVVQQRALATGPKSPVMQATEIISARPTSVTAFTREKLANASGYVVDDPRAQRGSVWLTSVGNQILDYLASPAPSDLAPSSSPISTESMVPFLEAGIMITALRREGMTPIIKRCEFGGFMVRASGKIPDPGALSMPSISHDAEFPLVG